MTITVGPRGILRIRLVLLIAGNAMIVSEAFRQPGDQRYLILACFTLAVSVLFTPVMLRWHRENVAWLTAEDADEATRKATVAAMNGEPTDRDGSA